jgi:hypothetical protein
LAQKGGIFHDINLIKKQSQATLAELKMRMFGNAFNSGAVAKLTVSGCKGTAWNSRYMVLLLREKYFPETF